MDIDVDQLDGNKLFEDINSDALRDFFDIGEEKVIGKDTEIITEGEEEPGFYFIHSGKAHVLKKNPEDDQAGMESIYVTTLEDGDSFGEMSLFSSNPVSASVVARSEKLNVSFFPREKLEEYFTMNQQFGFQFVLNLKNLIAERTRSTTDTLTQLKAKEGLVDNQELEEIIEGMEYYSYV